MKNKRFIRIALILSIGLMCCQCAKFHPYNRAMKLLNEDYRSNFDAALTLMKKAAGGNGTLALKAVDWLGDYYSVEAEDVMDEWLYSDDVKQVQVIAFCRDAEPWLVKAAENGHVQSQYQLYKIYILGPETNIPLGFKWGLKAAENGKTDAMFAIANKFLKDSTSEYFDDEKYREFIFETADKGYDAALFAAGEMCEEGTHGQAQDYKKAYAYYMRLNNSSSSQGYVGRSKAKIAALKYLGQGTEKDIDGAITFYNDALPYQSYCKCQREIENARTMAKMNAVMKAVSAGIY